MSNPPPVPLMRSLADTPQKQRDIQDLHTFLFLLRQQIGGDAAYDDLSGQIEQNINDIATNQTNIATNTAAIAALEVSVENNKRYTLVMT